MNLATIVTLFTLVAFWLFVLRLSLKLTGIAP